MGLLIFLPVGTLHYFNGWLFMCILFVPMFIAGFVLAGLDYRFSWFKLPQLVSYIFQVLPVDSVHSWL